MPDSSPVSRFETCLAIVLGFEGGFTDDPRDPGGATNFGVTRRTLAGWRGITPWQNLPVADARALGQPEATRIYRALYSYSCIAAQLTTGLDMAVFDFAVNSAPVRDITMLQQEVGAVPD